MPRAYIICKVSKSYKDMYDITKQTLCTTSTMYIGHQSGSFQQNKIVYQEPRDRSLPRKWEKHFGRVSYEAQ